MDEEKKDGEAVAAEEVEDIDIKEKITELQEEIEKIKEDFLYKAAEFENSKNRILREKENAVNYANESLLRDLLDPIDNLERALSAQGDGESIKEGVSMVEKQILHLLETSYGLSSYVPEAGDVFDPVTMEAISLIEGESGEGKVESVYLKGYKLKGRILRAAKVVVSKKKDI